MLQVKSRQVTASFVPGWDARASRSLIAFAACAALLSGCGGGGGKGPSIEVPAPVVSLTANPVSIASGQTSTLTWNAPSATSCAASGGWSGVKAASGSEVTAALTADTTYTLSCTNTAGSSAQSVTVFVTPPPTVTLTATPSTVTLAQSTTLTWTATNATSCTASGDWSGAKAPGGGSELISALLANATYTLTCSGVAGNASQTANVTVNTPPAGAVVITGKVEYERLVFNTTVGQGLNGAAPVVMPVRSAVIEALSPAPANTVLATTTTDAAGNYALVVNQNVSVRIRAKAQSLKTGAAPTWNLRVLNNTNSDALYVLDGTTFNSGVAQVNANHNLLAPSGWSGSSYTSTRFAAPFAILDTAVRARDLVLTGSGAATFPGLNLYWSTNNRPSSGALCTDNGNIGTSFFVTDGGNDSCGTLSGGIYILGEYTGASSDTDEFDAHVIAHEFGHYVEAGFSRSDTLGGEHGLSDRLDLRVAFGEGWGNAFSAIALNDPVYRDSGAGISADFSIDVETDDGTAEGWFSELSVGELLWDFFDGTSEPGDGVALGFAPIFAVMSGPQKNTDALTSIFSFAAALRAANPSQASAITARLQADQVYGSDAFALGESNDGGDPVVLPVYRDITAGTQLPVCVHNQFGSEAQSRSNKLGNSVFLRFVNPTTRLLTVTALSASNGTATIGAQDPDLYVWRQGVDFNVNGDDESGPTENTVQKSYPAGTYVIEVFDYELSGTNTTPRCMTVSITGN